MINGSGIMQIGHSFLGGGCLKRALSLSSAARFLHSFLCFGRCTFWHVALQYLTILQPLQQVLSPSPPFPLHPQAAQFNNFSSAVFIINACESLAGKCPTSLRPLSTLPSPCLSLLFSVRGRIFDSNQESTEMNVGNLTHFGGRAASLDFVSPSTASRHENNHTFKPPTMTPQQMLHTEEKISHIQLSDPLFATI